MMVIPSESGPQRTLCMPVRKLPAFLASINPSKVRVSLRPTIVRYQEECDNALWDYWTKGQAVKPDTSPFILPDQHLFLTRLLQSKVNAFPEPQRAKLYAQAWMRFKNKFRIAKIEQLPVAKLNDAVEYLTMQQLKLPNTVRQDAPALPSAEDTKVAIEASRKEWSPILNEAEKRNWAIQAEISAIATRVRKLAHETDGNDIAMTGNMAQAASDLIRNKADALCSGMDELLSLVNLCFSAIATNLQLKHAHRTLRDVRRALPA
jgi:hypothetical protein